jgi:NAD+ kinase
MIASVGLIYNQRIPEAVALCQKLQEQLKAMSRDVWTCQAHQLETAAGLARCDLIITLGGDGTILRAARLAAPQKSLVLGR